MAKDKSFDGTSWFINDNTVKTISELNEILSTDDIEKINNKEVENKEVTPKKANVSQSREVFNKGVFDNVGKAVVQLSDGKTMTLNGFWGYYVEGTTVEVTPKNMTYPYKAAHGELSDGFGYVLTVKAPTGEYINNVIATLDIEITSDNEKISDFDAVSLDYIPQSDLSYKTYTKKMAVDSTDDHTLIIKGVPSMGEDVDLFVGHWQKCSDTFISEGGSYSLGYILSHYNVFIRNNMNGTHLVGPHVIGGTAKVSLGGLSVITETEKYAPHNVPDYIGIKEGDKTVQTDSNIPVYIGKDEPSTSYSLKGNDGEIYYDYYFTSEFIDFDEAMSTLQSEAASFSGIHLSNTETQLKLDIGGSYEFTAEELSKISHLDLIGDFSSGKDTFVIVKDADATIKIPKTLTNGEEFGSIESGQTGSLVFLFPNAKEVTGDAISGHVVAPKAHVKLTGGYFNGCVIADSFDAEAEGHMWNYNGLTLISASTNLKFAKQVDGSIMDVKNLFEFCLEECDENGNVNPEGLSHTIYNTDNGKEDGRIVSSVDYAMPYEYDREGIFYYKLIETNKNDGIFNYDNHVFYIEVKTKKVVEGSTATIEIDSVRYFTIDKNNDKVYLENNAYPVFNNETITKELVKIEGKKTWNDADNQDGKRPSSITVNLFADGIKINSKVISQSDEWRYVFDNLDKYKDGKEIQYTITEDEVKGYTTEIDGTNIINTYTPEKTSVTGTKTWNDADNQDGKRPESITVNLFANGEKIASQVVTKDTDWKYAFNNLDKYKAGKEIKYTVTEDEVKGYTTEIDGTNIINTHTPEKTSVSGAKTWNDADNQDRIRPEQIVVRLYANGKEVASQEVTEATEWKYAFNDLDKYEAGEEIKYTVTEDEVKGYTTEIDGTNIINTHITYKTSVPVTKVWDDDNNRDKKRPSSITYDLYADGTKVASKTVTEADGWNWRFEDLDKYREGTRDQVYSSGTSC